MNQRPAHKGYILIVTLGALVLAATMLAALGRAAIDRTRAARAAVDELQYRWGVVSCRQSILPFADQILVRAELKTHQVVVSNTATLRLGKCNLRLIIADEQAKANVNAVLAADSTNASDRIRRAITVAGITSAIRLRPSIAPTSQPITGWGQIANAGDPKRLLPLSELLTCFGDGRINIMRASAPAIALAAPRLLAVEIERILKARLATAPISAETQGTTGVARLLTAAQVDPAKSANLTVGSACHALWIISDDGRRVWYDLAVRDDANRDEPHERCFSW